MDSARISKGRVLRHRGIGLFITINEDLSKALKEKLLFECSVTIEKTNETIFNGLNSKITNNQQNSAKNQVDIKDNSLKTGEFRKQQLNIDTKNKDEQQKRLKAEMIAKMRKQKEQNLFRKTTTEAKIHETQSSHADKLAATQSRSLYPSLKQESIHQRNPNVSQPSGIVNNHFEVRRENLIPSAPLIERQPAYNPFIQQREVNRERFNGVGKANKSKGDNCVVC